MIQREIRHSGSFKRLRFDLGLFNHEKDGRGPVSSKRVFTGSKANKERRSNAFKLTLVALSFFVFSVFSPVAYSITLDRTHNFIVRQDAKDWEQKTSMLHWRLLTQARRYDRVTDSSTIFNTTMGGVLQYKFYNELRFYGAFNAVFQVGHAQSRFGDLSPRTGLFLSDSYFLISPFAKKSGDFFTIEVGALNQSRTMRNKVLISGSAFPGVSEILMFSLGNFVNLTLRAQQMIPFSQVESAALSEREDTPYFLSESIKLSWDTKNFRASAMGGLFRYSELPSAVAQQSRILGNDVIGGQNNAEFVYDFNGWFANFVLSTYLSDKFLLQLRGFLVENQGAPQTLNRGQEFFGSLRFLGKTVWVGPYFGVFSLEPEISPAFYNASFFGNNNRDGWYVGLDVFVRQPSKMRVRIEYVSANLLNLRVFQEDQESVVLTLQTHFKKLGAW